MARPSVVIIDSGICNLFNVRGAFESLNANVIVTRSKSDILSARRVVLPGVGAFGAGMQSLEQCDLVDTIKNFVKSGKPILGICLGMQMLMSRSEEHGVWDGLGLIKGVVRSFQKPDAGGIQFKIPQIGWNFIERNERFFPPKDYKDGTVLDGLDPKPYMYFVHSYVVEPADERHCLTYTYYGKDKFCSVVKKNNVSGCQFHPERSGNVGLRILQNFLDEE